MMKTKQIMPIIYNQKIDLVKFASSAYNKDIEI